MTGRFFKNRNHASCENLQSMEQSVKTYELWGCNITISSLHAHTQARKHTHALGMGLSRNTFSCCHVLNKALFLS